MPTPDSNAPRMRRARLTGGLALAVCGMVLFTLAQDKACASDAPPLAQDQRAALERAQQHHDEQLARRRAKAESLRQAQFKDPFLRDAPAVAQDQRAALERAQQHHDEQLARRRAKAESLRQAQFKDPFLRDAPAVARARVEHPEYAHALLKSKIRKEEARFERMMRAVQPSTLAQQRAKQRKKLETKVVRAPFGDEESGSVLDLRSHAAQAVDARQPKRAPRRVVAQGEGARAGDAPRPVVLWRNKPVATTSGAEAVRMVLRSIAYLHGRGDPWCQQARTFAGAVGQGHASASFDQVWRGTLGLGYRTLPMVAEGNLRARIDQAIDDTSLDTATLDSALIALPRPMRFADLPQRDRIVAVVARSEPGGATTSRYVVAAKLQPDDAEYSVLTAKWGPEGTMGLSTKRLRTMKEPRLVMDQVEYVIYRPRALY